MAGDGRAALRERYWLTRFVFLRFLGLIYTVAFLILVQQLRPLIGAHGLLPVPPYLERVAAAYDGRDAAFFQLPTIFWFDYSDAFMQAAAWTGLGLALVVLFGFANVPILALLWILYLSFVQIGQLFYGYGWEILLLETGFLAIFIVPAIDPRPFPPHSPPPKPVIWLVRWVLFRVMLGAGLIKLRGDPCWRDLTCMMFHYETQPLPNPLSWYLHHLPGFVHRFEVLFNHLVELVVPFTLAAPRRLRHIGGLFLVAFQTLLIISGNLSFLNWLTLTLCIAAFDDGALAWMFPQALRTRVAALEEHGSRTRQVISYGLVALVAYLSIGPVLNLISPEQAMNTSFDRLHLVNTYGAFGSVGRRRPEIILEGTSSDDPNSADAEWRAYEFKCKPGDVNRRPCVVAPYQYRIDWQIWFAAMSNYQRNPWLIHLIAKLLRGDADTLGLMGNNPFPDAPPKFIRATLYRYEFTKPGDESGAWWTREAVDEYLPPVSSDDLGDYLRRLGWGE